MNVNFFPISLDKATGYGKASVNMIEAIKCAGHKVNVTSPGKQAGPADVDFYLRPPVWSGGRSKRKIAYFYWEAIPLPAGWAAHINSVDEIWAPCQLVADCCKLAGFTGKLRIVPTPALPIDFLKVPNITVNGVSDSTFVFYSISQWHNRKGWNELISAYLEEFDRSDDVTLIIKTNPISAPLQHKIPEDVERIKSDFKNKDLPNLVLIPSVVSEVELFGIHKIGHCYVSPHHGEGWGMSTHDAIMAGKQIIATKFGGVIEYLEDQMFHPVPFDLVPVTGMEWNGAYNSSQQWAQPSVVALKGIMRDVFKDHKKYIWKNMLMNKAMERLTFDRTVLDIKNLL